MWSLQQIQNRNGSVYHQQRRWQNRKMYVLSVYAHLSRAILLVMLDMMENQLIISDNPQTYKSS